MFLFPSNQVCLVDEGDLATVEGRGSPRRDPHLEVGVHGTRRISTRKIETFHQSARIGNDYYLFFLMKNKNVKPK